MCELLALHFNKPVHPDFSFRGFCHRGSRNPHGWGLAWFDDSTGWQVVKRTCAANQSRVAASLLKHCPGPSRTFLGHVRLASQGRVSVKNTHPFIQPFGLGHVALIHNGTLSGLPATRRQPLGETDSEHLLCLLLDRLEDVGATFEDYDQVEAALQDLNQYGTLNAVLSDGSFLYAYRDKNGYNGLYQTVRVPPFTQTRLLDEELCLDLAKVKESGTFGFVLATRPLTNEKWEPLRKGKISQFIASLKTACKRVKK